MTYLHHELDLEAGDAVEVHLTAPANVRLLDDANWMLYQKGKVFRFRGGHQDSSPVQLEVPRAGRWHLVVDLGGSAGSVSASYRILQGAA